MKRATAATPDVTPTNPVEIAITVARFADVLAPDGSPTGPVTTYRMKLRKKDPRVVIRGDDIYVARPGAILRFTLASSAGDKARYYPLGIAFVREGARNTDDAQRLGLRNFPQDRIRLEGQTLAIVDTYQDGKGRIRYKFSIALQRGSDGKIGIIDPGIVHENDH